MQLRAIRTLAFAAREIRLCEAYKEPQQEHSVPNQLALYVFHAGNVVSISAFRLVNAWLSCFLIEPVALLIPPDLLLTAYLDHLEPPPCTPRLAWDS
jgi:hypothetical protein